MTPLPEKLKARFGVDTFEDLLGNDVLSGLESISHHLCSVWGMTDKQAYKFRTTHIPHELLDPIADKQKALSVKHRKETCLAKYGSACSLQNPEVRSKAEATLEARFGVKSPFNSPEIRAKRDANNVIKFGSASPLSNPSVIAKREATNLTRYGCKNQFSRPDIQEQIRETNLARYGSVDPGNLPEFRAKARQTSLIRYNSNYPNSLPPQEILRRLDAQNLEPLIEIKEASDEYKGGIPVRCKLCGHEFTTKLDVSGTYLSKQFGGNAFRCCECQNHGTKLQDFVRDYIRSLGYTCRQWSHIDWMKNQEIDCYVEELSIGFEVNGYLTHNAESNPYGDDPKDKTFHQFKSQACLEHGISLYHIWHYANSDSEQLIAKSIVDRAIGIATSGHLSGVDPGDKLNRDTLPDPSVVGLPYIELPPEPFDSPNGICYNSGYWQF